MKLRGIKDIFIACIDNLKGLAEAIEDMFPSTDVQLCLVHQMRNSMKYITDKDIKPMVKDLKKVYKAVNAEMARHYLQEAELKWSPKYSIIFKSWNANWDRLINFLKYPPALRRNHAHVDSPTSEIQSLLPLVPMFAHPGFLARASLVEDHRATKQSP